MTYIPQIIMPTGSCTSFLSASAPDGYLPMQGGTFTKVDYPDLWAFADANSWPGTTATDFVVPDMTYRTPIGIRSTGTTLGIAETVGEETHQLTVDEMPIHNHLTPDMHDPAGGTSTIGSGAGNVEGPQQQCTDAGGDLPHNNMQPSLGVLWCVKT